MSEQSAPTQPAPTDSSTPAVSGRSDPPYAADERTMLESWLEFHRATLLWKCEGLTDEQLRTRSVEPSTLSLLGLVRHMAEVERAWFRRCLAGEDASPYYYSDADPDGDFDRVDAADVAADLATYRAEAQACREIAARYDDLGTVGAARRHGHDVSLRWIYVHMIEEYARHNGHADLLRERIDGVTGD
jgi:uncharacterized damage-inducible protein DinB